MVDYNIKDLKTSWDLSDYYTGISDSQIDKDVNTISELVDKFVEKYKGKIAGLSEDELIQYFKDENEFGDLATKIQIYMLYISSLDTQNQEILKKESELTHKFTEIFNKLTFTSQEFKDRGYDDLIKLSESSKLVSWKNYFFQKAQSIKYLLDENIEKVLNIKGPSSGKSAFSNLYEELTGSFMFKVKDFETGEYRELTDAETRSLMKHKDERVRKEARRAIREVYSDKKVQITLGNCYSNILKDYTSDNKLRGLKTVMEKRNINEELDNSVVDTLLSEVEKSYPLFQRFLKIKAKLLGKEKLNVWDVYAPIGENDKEYSFEDGLSLFLDTIKEFDEEFYNFSVDMFKKSRVDVFPGKGKRGGAFACYDKGFDSYVLLNWTNKLGDVSTLAHELGHATHGHLSQVQENEVYSTGMCLAETASVFNEMVLSEAIMSKLSDDEKLSYLNEKLEDIFATIHRQIQYILFERRCHQKISDGEGLTYEDFNTIWREEQVKMSGTEFIEYDSPENEEISWSTIPHIFRSPFYCYAYSFGNILTFALFNEYKTQGKEFVSSYKEFLKSGGSLPPAQLVKKTIGKDISKPEYYQGAFDVISDMLDEFEELSNK